MAFRYCQIRNSERIKKENIMSGDNKKGEQDPSPHPLARRVCSCGCENIFQPINTRHYYLNKQHANFAYNHGARKENQANQNRDEKIQRSNDHILAKYFKSSPANEVTIFLKNLTLDDFDPAYFVSSTEIDGVTFFYSYNYLFTIYKLENEEIIKILKQ
ncbi:hypothetical protein N8Z90_01090 [Crocinitomicaceae bacterium]|nr:hypothetical protein [Crocinitomicaceae bacterium]